MLLYIPTEQRALLVLSLTSQSLSFPTCLVYDLTFLFYLAGEDRCLVYDVTSLSYLAYEDLCLVYDVTVLL